MIHADFTFWQFWKIHITIFPDPTEALTAELANLNAMAAPVACGRDDGLAGGTQVGPW